MLHVHGVHGTDSRASGTDVHASHLSAAKLRRLGKRKATLSRPLNPGSPPASEFLGGGTKRCYDFFHSQRLAKGKRKRSTTASWQVAKRSHPQSAMPLDAEMAPNASNVAANRSTPASSRSATEAQRNR
eukprot:scaffold378_cov248-Pinguiococcus_pyrenoidosus.AAC.2